MEIKKEVYEAPTVEVVEVMVEQGFQMSGGIQDPGGTDDSPTW